MYDIPELRSYCPPTRGHASGRLCFSIYYEVPDRAFEYAARTWVEAVKRQESFGTKDEVRLLPVKTERDFKLAWGQIASGQGSRRVAAGSVFSHAEKTDDEDDGLEFKPGGRDDGTLGGREMDALPVLKWTSHGWLLLAGCNTGYAGSRGWTPAERFARRQQVVTVGQVGFAYFSCQWHRFGAKSPKNTRISLWAYRRGQNQWNGNGGRIPAQVVRP